MSRKTAPYYLANPTFLSDKPHLIISNPQKDEGDPDPDIELRKFSNHEYDWAVSVDKISEGVDIPTICLIVYATRKKTALRIRQTVARAQRKLFDDNKMDDGMIEPHAQILYPAVPSFVKEFTRIEEDVLEAYKYVESDEKDEDEDESESEPRKPREPNLEDFETTILSEAIYTGTSSGSQFYQPSEVHTMETKLSSLNISPRLASYFLRYEQAYGKANTSESPKGEPTQPDPWSKLNNDDMDQDDKKKARKDQLVQLVRSMAFRRVNGDYKQIKGAIQDTWKQLNKKFNKPSSKGYTMAEINEAIRYLNSFGMEE